MLSDERVSDLLLCCDHMDGAYAAAGRSITDQIPCIPVPTVTLRALLADRQEAKRLRIALADLLTCCEHPNATDDHFTEMCKLARQALGEAT